MLAEWTADELSAIDDAQEVRVAGRRQDGSLRRLVTIWAVRLGDDVYIRSVRGPDGGWYRGATATHEGRLEGAGVERDVIFVDAGDEPDNAIDAAYRDKYRDSPESIDDINAPQARSTTLRVVPR
jgi:hypothetical protein